ncbi:MAG: ABC transporter ATP-binding protein [Actinomycetota bacterium]
MNSAATQSTVTTSEVVLSVQDLSVVFNTPDGAVRAVSNVSFDLRAGSTLGIVGESGSGKSVTAGSIMRLNTSSSATTTGRILVGGVDVLTLPEEEVRNIRGSQVAMVFQDPMSALNPYYTIGDQISEAFLAHHPKASKGEARAVSLDMLTKVGIPNPSRRIDEFPHQLSGGMRQRIVIAIALVNNPRILIADEPTTALDVTVQAQILELMMELQRSEGMSIILITHDLGVVAETADDVLVMYGGRVVERTDVNSLFDHPTHPYSWGLLRSVLSLGESGESELFAISGTPPSMISPPSGCAFHQRCSFASSIEEKCASEVPVLRSVAGTSSESACHLTDAIKIDLSKSPAQGPL